LTLLPRLATARLLAWLLLALFIALPARAQGIELTSLALQKLDAGLTLDFTARVQLPHAVQDAVQRGVPVYFVAEANVYRHRWYWRDQRVARAARSWRLSYQPLGDVGRGALEDRRSFADRPRRALLRRIQLQAGHHAAAAADAVRHRRSGGLVARRGAGSEGGMK
jgi:hypothetical protein